MTTTDKKPADNASHHQQYEEALNRFGVAIGLLQSGAVDEARQAFIELERANAEEPALADRARSYRKICERRLAPPPAPPQDADGLYVAGVIASNNGDYDEALALLERALRQTPDSPKVLYARASTWSLKGNAEAAVAELRRAIAVDPRVRFQAANDPDFEPIREEPAFIDIIEPTPSGA
ncbi:MAG TPA: tetratricopeptide repeat protein [Candidatus Polarisedimenticolaceae bacterium]|nr:tetratricopeptide repeat protein [Candidatus Polarisedimenticolaceae bacterium]